MDAIIVGIDVFKDKLDVGLRPGGESFVVERNATGIAALIERLKPLSVKAVALEATGGFETVVAASLGAASLPVAVVNPAQVRSYTQALGRRVKTDAIDAVVIARFVEAAEVAIRQLPDAATRLLSDLVARRRQIVEMIVAEGQRKRRMQEKRLLKSIERLLAALQKELSEIDVQIDENVCGSPMWRQKQEPLVSVPGVGKEIARTLIADLPELRQIDRREIAALVGLAPWTRQSGQWTGKSLIGGGRSATPTALYMGALVASRFNTVLKDVYQRLLAAGKPKMVALIVVARRLLIILNAILRDAKPWNPEARHA